MARFKLTKKNTRYPIEEGEVVFINANSEWDITSQMLEEAVKNQLNKRLSYLFSRLDWQIEKV